MKKEFLDYIGGVSDLRGYQRSYKLIFYKCFFERKPFTASIPALELTKAFQQFYIDRKNQGLLPDINVDDSIAYPEKSSLQSVYKLILRNPFNAISGQGYFQLETVDQVDYFVINKQLEAELAPEDIESILEIVEQKIAYYYNSIGSTKEVTGMMRQAIEKFINEYEKAKTETFAQHPYGIYVRNDLPKVIYNTGVVDKNDYLISGSVGQGTWANVPWVCIFDRRITTSATKGVYIVYLLSKDTNTLYLTFNQGCTEIRNQNRKRDTIKIMRDRAAEIIAAIDSRGFRSDEDINLGSDITELAELYQKGTIFYKAYHKGQVPPEEELQDDLRKMIEIAYTENMIMYVVNVAL